MKRLLFVQSGLPFALILLWIFPLSVRSWSPVVLSEFMADNTRTLFDEDGDSEDWIEVHNVGTESVNLLGWALTDDSGDLAKWRFPATNLNVGAYLVVFASDKDRRVPGRPLHTNFKLSPGGDYLALVEPNGTNIASLFAPRYPTQVPNVSFGFGLLSSNTTLIGTGAAVRVLVPTAANGGSALGDSWQGGREPFDDGGWRAGVTGVGYSDASAPSLVGTSAMTVRLSFDAPPAGAAILDTKPIGAPLNGANTGALWVASSTDNSPTPIARSGVMQFFAPSNSQVRLAPNAAFNAQRGTFTFWMRSLGLSGAGQGPAALLDRQLTTTTRSGGLLTQTEDGRLEMRAYANGVVANAIGTASAPSDDRWHHIAVVYAQTTNGSMAIYIDGVLDRSATNSRPWTWPATAPLELGRSHDASFRKYHGLLDDFRAYNRDLTAAEIARIFAGDDGVSAADLGTDVSAEMLHINSSAFVRLAFTVPDPNAFSLLTLRVRHSDGFAAWINGRFVGQVNAPEATAWDSAATGPHSSSLADSLTLGNPTGLLRAGLNVLAVQGMTVSASAPTFLVLPELSAASVPIESVAGLYFTRPSPGAANSGGSTNIGPAITEVRHVPNVPADAEDVRVTARLEATFNAISNVTLRYRIMYAPEVSVPMNDLGVDGDAVARDGVWSGLIPASASTNGQMIRYYVSALDVLTNASKWPLFYSPTNSEQYLGTIVDVPALTSKLPIYHLFLNPADQAAADGENGARCSVFSDGEFYDNVRIELRGNSSASFRKKAHRLEFNRDHRFRHLPGYPRIGDTSFLGESADPAYMRQMMSFWLAEGMGVPAPFSYPVRLQLNTAFYQLALHSDVMGMEQLERMGYDPQGALYKAIGQLVPSLDSTGGFEKRTRLYEDLSDYLALANGIAQNLSLAARTTNVFDLLDVPNVVSYLAVARWVQEGDDVWANMTIYRDSLGDGLWRVIPFDMNVSWGQLYCADNPTAFAQLLATNDVYKSHPFYGGSTVQVAGSSAWNRLYDVIITVPQTREMLLRRMRTLLDEFIQPPGTHPMLLQLDQRLLSFSNSVHSEAILDRLRWGWENTQVGAPAAGPYCFGTNQWVTNHLPEIIKKYIAPRRQHWYVTHSITNRARALGITTANNAGIPLQQPVDASIQLAAVEFNPASGNQAEEYLCLTNPNPYAVDISGWKIGGAVEFTFRGGTVLGSNRVLYVSPDTRAFRNRSVPPRGGMGLFAVGPYQGQLSARGEPITITDTGGRLVYTNRYPGLPGDAQQFLRVTELMYNPSGRPGDPTDPQEFEYIELRNISVNTYLDLAGIRFTSGILFDFTDGATRYLNPGQRVLVVKNLAAFTARYGSAGVAGQYTGNLDNAGERIQLLDTANEEILDFTYNDGWHPATDGLGFSLVIADEIDDAEAWSRREGWRPSGLLHGAPGQDDPSAPSFPNLLVNEVLAHVTTPQLDAIELFNPTTSPVDLSGWFLSDDRDTPKKYRITNGCVIAAGGYLVFDASLFDNPATALMPFGLSANGDSVWLFSGDAHTNLTGYVFGEDFGASANGVTLGRHTNSIGQVHFVSQATPSLGGPNRGPQVGPVVLSEIMYHPPEHLDGSNNSDDEYLEVQNGGTQVVLLFNPSSPADTWRLRGEVDYEFPAGLALAPAATLLVVNFDTNETRRLAAFRSRYQIPASVPILGPYRGLLANSSANLRLEQPAQPDAGQVPYLLVDRVEYADDGNWPGVADGAGASLQRVSTTLYGNDPANWNAGAPQAGAPVVGGGTVPSIAVQPSDQFLVAGRSATFNVTATGTEPLGYQWYVNGNTLLGANEPSLVLQNVQPSQRGTYSVTVYNPAGSATSSNASLDLFLPVRITSEPVPVTVRGSTNNHDYGTTTNTVRFSVQAVSDDLIGYQWRFNGIDIPGATSPTLTLSNVNLSHDGLYTVLMTDDQDTIISDPARLKVQVPPTFLQVPANQIVVSNTPFTVSVAIRRGNPPLFRYDWREVSTLRASISTPQTTNFFTSAPITNSAVRTWTLIVANDTNLSVQTTFTVTAAADTDRDGIPDSVELTYGFDPRSNADGTLDADGDGLSNWAEYIAGTDPTNSLSRLRVDLTLGGVTSLTFEAQPHKTYSVQFTDDLSAAWSKLEDVIAHPQPRQVTLTDQTATAQRYYRLLTPARP